MGSVNISFDVDAVKDGEAVQLKDGTLMPREFTAIGTLAIEERVEIELQIRIDDSGRHVCRGMKLTALDPEVAVTATLVQAMPFAKVVKQATAAAKSLRHIAGEEAFVARNTNSGVDYGALVKQSKSPRKNSPLTADNGAEIRRVISKAEAAGDSPTKAVMEAFFVSRTTAWRWIKSAQ